MTVWDYYVHQEQDMTQYPLDYIRTRHNLGSWSRETLERNGWALLPVWIQFTMEGFDV